MRHIGQSYQPPHIVTVTQVGVTVTSVLFIAKNSNFPDTNLVTNKDSSNNNNHFHWRRIFKSYTFKKEEVYINCCNIDITIVLVGP